MFSDPKLKDLNKLEDILNTELQSDFTEFMISARKTFKKEIEATIAVKNEM